MYFGQQTYPEPILEYLFIPDSPQGLVEGVGDGVGDVEDGVGEGLGSTCFGHHWVTIKKF